MRTAPEAPEILPGRVQLHVGWHELHPDVSLNFQLNRWAAYGGAGWLAEVRPELPRLTTYEAWRAVFVELGERAAAQRRTLDAALHFRCAEFFMVHADPRKEPLRRRLLPMLREAAGVPESTRVDVPFGRLRLPAWRFDTHSARGTCVVFGGFDSYIEEFFPIVMRIRDAGWNVVAFEGPGQGSVLEEQRAPLTPAWHGPVGAVLDTLGLDQVTLVGVSLGGCLAVRAAAFEPRVLRVVAFDVLSDFFGCMLAQQPAFVGLLLQALFALGATSAIDRAAARRAARQPLAEWGLAQAMHVFGCDRPSGALRAARAFHTRDLSQRVRQDVLLLAGANDHYVPRAQLLEQAQLLRCARSITTRLFTHEEQAQAHCQVGNLPLAVRVISTWLSSLEPGGDERDSALRRDSQTSFR